MHALVVLILLPKAEITGGNNVRALGVHGAKHLISKTTEGIWTKRERARGDPRTPIEFYYVAQNFQNRTSKSHTLVHKQAQTPNFASAGSAP